MREELDKLNLVELLDLLEPVPEPPPVSLWPQTAGWFWIGLVLLILLAWFVRRWLLHRRANAYRRAALTEIAGSDENPVVIAGVLRRTALAAFPRAEVANLYGEDWLQFLDKTYSGNGFSKGPGRAIATVPYKQAASAPDLAPLATEWVLRHRREEASST